MTQTPPKETTSKIDPGELDPELAELAAEVEQEIPGWKPEPGETIAGTVKRVQTAGQGSQFGEYPLLLVRIPSGTLVNVHAFHTALKREVERAALQPGDKVAIKYLGHQQGGSGPEGFEGYRLSMKRPNPAEAAAERLEGRVVA